MTVYAAGSGFSIESSGFRGGEADGIFYGLDIFRGKTQPVVL